MKKVAAVIVIIIIVVASAELLTSGSSLGYHPDDLVAPEIVYAEPVNVSVPSSTPASGQRLNVELRWSVTEDIYAGSGGALWLNVTNMQPGQVYIYGFGLEWDDGTYTRRNCSVYVSPGETSPLGLLVFDAPDDPGTHNYHVTVKVAAAESEFRPPLDWKERWIDHGEVNTPSKVAKVLAPFDENDPEVTPNIPRYYGRINSLVSYEVGEAIADDVRAERPGEYNILQVAEAFEWIRGNIEYLEEEQGEDYWQSAQETMDQETGDCEDHAILMASAIGALGGNARVNIIQGHAFPTVFVGTTEQQMDQAEEAIASYYGLPRLNVAYLIDDMGYWLVVDTTGFPYAGGIPAKSGLTADGDWSMDSSFLYSIDATGETRVSLFDR